VVSSQRKEFRRDPTSTTDAGGSPDPELLIHHDSDLLHAMAEFAEHFGKGPDQLDVGHLRLYQLFLVKEKKVSLPRLSSRAIDPDGTRPCRTESLGHFIEEVVIPGHARV
jgi:hypothetical protein